MDKLLEFDRENLVILPPAELLPAKNRAFSEISQPKNGVRYLSHDGLVNAKAMALGPGAIGACNGDSR